MPDYRHIKKKAENENQEYERKLEALKRKYFDCEDLIVDAFKKSIHEMIERKVSIFYRAGTYCNIHKLGTVFPRYTLTEKRFTSYCIYSKYVINTNSFDHFLCDPQKTAQTCLTFPSEDCLHSFLEKTNRVLGKDKIRVSAEEDNMTGSCWFSVFAKLGKL